MDREILYRAKKLKLNGCNGDWERGFYVKCQGYHYILSIYDDRGFHKECSSWFKVDPKTVCQYTGLTDKNGRKIFEGDIVKLILPNGEIRFFKVSIKNVVRKVLCHPDFDDEVSEVEITGIVFEWNGYDLFPCTDTYGVADYKMMEVVGNIFDNQN